MMIYSKFFIGILVVIGWLPVFFNPFVRFDAPVVFQTQVLSDTIDPFEDQMILVKGGTFLMGGPGPLSDQEAKWQEKPQHKAVVKDFYLSKYEVTQAQWRSVMGCDPPSRVFKFCAECPVNAVSWPQVQDFLAMLNKKTGKKYRLPSEKEWEYAARGGKYSKDYKYAGSDAPDEVAWHARNSSFKLHLVGQKKENELGFFDMTGNVMEWTQDLAQSYTDLNKLLDTETHRVIRGGSFLDKPEESRVYSRKFEELMELQGSIGFRLAL